MTVDPIVQLKEGCGYQGYEFGANYPDSICFDGQLWDADNFEDGYYLEPMEYWPCPMCKPMEYIKSMGEYHSNGYFWHDVWAYVRATILWIDIKKNRLLGTEPWKHA